VLSPDQQRVFDAIDRWIRRPQIVAPGQKHPNLLSLGGYAGTGKTTIVAQVCALHAHSTRMAFVAVSGRASSVLRRKLARHGVPFAERDEVTGKFSDGHFGDTIHRLIYISAVGSSGTWMPPKLRRELAVPANLIVVDEASMVGDAMYRDLLSFGVPVLAVGDHGQLPPVRAKKGFNLMEAPHLRLETIHRQAESSPILRLAAHVRAGGQLRPSLCDGVHVDWVRRRDSEPELARGFLNWERPEEGLDTVVLAPTNRRRVSLNTWVRRARHGCERDVPPVAGEIVINLENCAPVYNGFRGILLADAQPLSSLDYKFHVSFPEEGCLYIGRALQAQLMRPEKLTRAELDALGAPRHWKQLLGTYYDYAYAVTCHKAQGSEFRHVYVWAERPSHASDDGWARWLYTAVTRARDRLTLLV